MSVQLDDVWAMWALWHWRAGIYGPVFGTRKALKAHLIGTQFVDETDFRANVGRGRPYKLVKVDVTRATE